MSPNSDILSLHPAILYNILSMLRPSQALQFARTCHTARAAALPRILSDVHLRPTMEPASDLDRVKQFCQFVLMNPTDRGRCIRSLRIMTVHHDLSTTSLLGTVLMYATGLRELHVESTEAILKICPGFTVGVNCLKELTTVSLLQGGLLTRSLLSQMKVRLQHIKIVAEDNILSLADAIMFYAGCVPCFLADSLQELVVCNLDLGRVIDLKWTIWSSVHTVALSGDVDICLLARAFPALRKLTLATGSFSMREPGPHSFWSNLDHLDIAAAPDVSLPFPCPVRRLSLPRTLPITTTGFISRPPPTVLHCHLNIPGDIDTLTDFIWTANEALYADIQIYFSEPLLPFEYWMPRLKHEFRFLPLAGLTLRFRTNGIQEVAFAFVEELVQTIPTLVYVGVQNLALQVDRNGQLVSGPTALIFFRLVRLADGRVSTLQQLSEWEGEDVERKLVNTGRW